MADHSTLQTTENYAALLGARISGRMDDQALGFDPSNTSPTNIKINTIRWVSTSSKWQKWNGTDWIDLASTYSMDISGNSATATSANTVLNYTGSSTGATSPIGTLRFSNPGAAERSITQWNGASNESFDWDFGNKKLRGVATGIASSDVVNVGQMNNKVDGFRADLTNNTDPIRGAGIPGFLWTTQYPPNSIGSAVKKLRNIREFGNFIGDGIADDSAVWLAAANSGEKLIDARGVNSKVLTTLNISDDQDWMLTSSKIKTEGTNLTLFRGVAKKRFNLIGPFKITGDLTTNPGTSVGSAAIQLEDCSDYLISHPYIDKMRGWGIYTLPGASTRDRADGGLILSPRIRECVWGMEDVAGTGAEYSTVIDARITKCFQAGAITSAGNILWNGGHIVDNLLDGMIVKAGSNHAHGIVTGMNINHNNRFNLETRDVVNGQDFIGCHFYGNGSGSGAIFLNNSKGINIDGGVVDCWIYNYEGAQAGRNYIKKVYCPGGYGTVKRLDASSGIPKDLILSGLTGPGSVDAGIDINDPSEVFVHARREANNLQTLSGGLQTLVFNDVQINGDRRKVYNSNTGQILVTQPGFYNITVSACFSGTGLTTTGSYVQINSTGQSPIGCGLTLFSPTLMFAASTTNTIYLNTGDVVTVSADIAGTTKSFGSIGFLSKLTLEKKSST